jgi:hypothetical protein
MVVLAVEIEASVLSGSRRASSIAPGDHHAKVPDRCQAELSPQDAAPSVCETRAGTATSQVADIGYPR